MTSRNWCFTINNYTAEELEATKTWECRRIVVGEEVGEGGTPHLQGAITFANAVRFGHCKKLHDTAHWEPARDADAAFRYCKKDGKFWEKDDRKQGTRSDIKKAVEMVKAGASIFDIAIETESYTAARMAELMYRNAPFRSIFVKREVIWFWGPTHGHKSRLARELWPDLYWKKTYHWWNGYCNNETVLIDDFRAKFCPYDDFLTMTDCYTYLGETKGGWIPIPWKRMVFTSPYHPREVYKGATTEDIRQLLRRLTEVRYYDTIPFVDVTDVTVTEVGCNTKPDVCDTPETDKPKEEA